jgi:hypothetical protein
LRLRHDQEGRRHLLALALHKPRVELKARAMAAAILGHALNRVEDLGVRQVNVQVLQHSVAIAAAHRVGGHGCDGVPRVRALRVRDIGCGAEGLGSLVVAHSRPTSCAQKYRLLVLAFSVASCTF